MKKIISLIFGCALYLSAPCAHAQGMLDFTYTASGQTGLVAAVAVDVTYLGSGLFDVTGGTVTLTDPTAGSWTGLLGTFTLLPDPGNNPVLSPSGQFIYDSLVSPYAAVYLDVNGLLFTEGSNEVNIWFNGGNYSAYDWNGTTYDASTGDINLPDGQNIPEPLSAALLVVGMTAVGVAARRRRPA